MQVQIYKNNKNTIKNPLLWFQNKIALSFVLLGPSMYLIIFIENGMFPITWEGFERARAASVNQPISVPL